jgi:cell division protein FtsB
MLKRENLFKQGASLLERIKAKKRKKVLRKFLHLFLIVFVVYTYFGGNYGFLRILSLVNKKTELQKESKLLQAQIVDLELEKKKLNEDLFYIEKIARERYGMIKKDELVIKFIPPNADSTKK